MLSYEVYQAGMLEKSPNPDSQKFADSAKTHGDECFVEIKLLTAARQPLCTSISTDVRVFMTFLGLSFVLILVSGQNL